jgi:hypothetical protein
MFIIEDEIHSELMGEFESFEKALLELKRISKTPWDQEPNRAPCTSWKTCGRSYEIIEFDNSKIPWKEIRRSYILEIKQNKIKWEKEYQEENQIKNA